MKHLTIIITSILIALSININAQEINYPKVTVEGKTYYEYTVVAGDGLYSIARRFGISPKELNESNPELTTDIKPGQKLLIPCKEEIKENVKSEDKIHVVEAKQTLYAISKLYGISIDSLIKLNPEARQGIRTGDKLYISRNNAINKSENKNEKTKHDDNDKIEKTPNKEKVTDNSTQDKVENDDKFILHKVEKKETLYAISKKYQVSIDEIINYNPDVKAGLKAGMTIKIPTAVSPKEVEKIEQPETKKDNKHENKSIEDNKSNVTDYNNNNKNSEQIISSFEKTSSDVNIAYILPLGNLATKDANQRFIEFYRGSMLAMKEAKAKGFNAHIFTYNTKGEKEILDSILSLPELKNMDVIIGPAYTEELTSLLTFTKANNISTLVPFSSKIDENLHFPRLLQFNPSDNFIVEKITNNQIFNNTDTKYIFVEYDNCVNKGSIICNQIKERQQKMNFECITLKATKDVDSLIIAASENSKKALVIFGSSQKNDISSTISKLRVANKSNIYVWGYDNWESDLTLYPRTYYATLFDPNSIENYNLQYKEWFGPHLLTGYTKYDLIGYDLSTFVLQSMMINSDKSFILRELPSSTYYQSEPKFQFINNRYLNTNVYLFYWDGTYLNDIK